jgi:GNAT superfamily N-acetyltransferase
MDRGAILKAFEANLWDRAAFLPRARKDAVVEDSADLLLVNSGLPSADFNTIGKSSLHPRFGSDRAEAAIKHFKDKKLPFTWIIGPLSGHGAMEPTLKSFGLACPEDQWVMVMSLDTVNIPGAVPGGLDVKRVSNAAQVEHFADVLTAATPADENIKTFYTDTKDAITAPASPLRLYVGYIGGEPVAVLEAFSAHGILNLYTMSSLASVRGKGYTAGLMLTALKDAKKAGLRLASLQTPEAGRAAYERFGFKPAARIASYK